MEVIISTAIIKKNTASDVLVPESVRTPCLSSLYSFHWFLENLD